MYLLGSNHRKKKLSFILFYRNTGCYILFIVSFSRHSYKASTYYTKFHLTQGFKNSINKVNCTWMNNFMRSGSLSYTIGLRMMRVWEMGCSKCGYCGDTRTVCVLISCSLSGSNLVLLIAEWNGSGSFLNVGFSFLGNGDWDACWLCITIGDDWRDTERMRWNWTFEISGFKCGLRPLEGAMTNEGRLVIVAFPTISEEERSEVVSIIAAAVELLYHGC